MLKGTFLVLEASLPPTSTETASGDVSLKDLCSTGAPQGPPSQCLSPGLSYTRTVTAGGFPGLSWAFLGVLPTLITRVSSPVVPSPTSVMIPIGNPLVPMVSMGQRFGDLELEPPDQLEREPHGSKAV